MKRVAAPSHWMLGKMDGVYAPRPSSGPHKLRECIPLIILLRNRLKYALTYNEVKLIVMQRAIEIDAKVRTDMKYPTGFMDVISIAKTNEHFRLLLDTKGRFVPIKISNEEASYKLCKVKKVLVGAKSVPYAVTHDGRTIRYIRPDIKANDTLRIELKTGKIVDHVKFEIGNLVMVTGGHSIGCVGTIQSIEKHTSSFHIIHVKDSRGHVFSTRMNNIFVIGKRSKTWVTLPKAKGIKYTNIEDRNQRLNVTQKSKD